MYGKHFSSMYTGSMFGSGAEVFAVWGYVLAHAMSSRVELNPMLVAAILGEPVELIEGAIDRLCSPDPRSRCKASEGRRLVKEGEFQYFVPSWEEYNRIRSREELREYNRRYQAASRAKSRAKDQLQATGSEKAALETQRTPPDTISPPIVDPGASGEPHGALWGRVNGVPVMEFVCREGGRWGLSEKQMDELVSTYPDLGEGRVKSELLRAQAWLVNNPMKRKTTRGMMQYLHSWLGGTLDNMHIHQASTRVNTPAEEGVMQITEKLRALGLPAPA